ncbi:hypothetical protein K474DRAFT_24669 [Panus rudis PR-1116 ss-1]|nr:hypothetical protein K474DRAFT_24669 [Panus rudis PR-1116 ss-1]
MHSASDDFIDLVGRSIPSCQASLVHEVTDDPGTRYHNHILRPHFELDAMRDKKLVNSIQRCRGGQHTEYIPPYTRAPNESVFLRNLKNITQQSYGRWTWGHPRRSSPNCQ